MQGYGAGGGEGGGERVVVNFPALAKASEDINRALVQMRQQLDDCESSAQPLVASWEGKAQEAYMIRQARWRQAANSLAETLGEIKRAVDLSAQDFQQTEDRNTNMFN